MQAPRDGMHARMDGALKRALDRACQKPAPSKLTEALFKAVLPGGARVRPQLCFSVAKACGDDKPAMTDAAATALELIHCASLVHDDLPCFDNAPIRRGKPAIHRVYGEEIAVLVGDSLIVLAFETLAQAGSAQAGEGQAEGSQAGRALQLIQILGRTTGAPFGICAGQAWESETKIHLEAYHRSKTGALFMAATQMGAVAAGGNPEDWTELGERLGEAYQVADDLRDVLLNAEELGKPAGQDAAHARPNAVDRLGVEGALRRLNDTLAGAISSIPSCDGEAELCALVRHQAERLTPFIVEAAQ